MKDGPEYLKMERLKRGWTLQDVSDRTQINITVLKALESGKTTEMVSPVAAEALLLKYSAALGIEAGQHEEPPHEEPPHEEPPHEEPPHEERPHEERPRGAQTPAGRRSPFVYVLLGLALGAVIAAVCLGIVFLPNFYRTHPPAGHHLAPHARIPSPPASVASKAKRSGTALRKPETPKSEKKAAPAPPPAAAVPAPAASAPSAAAGGTAGPAAVPKPEKKAASAPPPAATVPAPAASAPSVAAGGTAGPAAAPKPEKKAAPAPPPAAAVPAPAASAPSAAAGGTAGPAAAPKGSAPTGGAHPGTGVPSSNISAPVSAGQPSQVPAGRAPAIAPEQPAVPATHSLKITANRKAWVRVVIDGRKTESLLMQPGQIRQWKADRRVYLIVGNAGGVRVTWDGKPVKMSKEFGCVERLWVPGR